MGDMDREILGYSGEEIEQPSDEEKHDRAGQSSGLVGKTIVGIEEGIFNDSERKGAPALDNHGSRDFIPNGTDTALLALHAYQSPPQPGSFSIGTHTEQPSSADPTRFYPDIHQLPWETAMIFMSTVEEKVQFVPLAWRKAALALYKNMRTEWLFLSGRATSLFEILTRDRLSKEFQPLYSGFMGLRLLDKLCALENFPRNPTQVARRQFIQPKNLRGYRDLTKWADGLRAVQRLIDENAVSLQDDAPPSKEELAVIDSDAKEVALLLWQLTLVDKSHRRLDLALILNNISSAAFFISYFKSGHADLPSNSKSIKDIIANDAYTKHPNLRPIAQRVQIVKDISPMAMRSSIYAALALSPLILLSRADTVTEDMGRGEMFRRWSDIGNRKPRLVVDAENGMWRCLMRVVDGVSTPLESLKTFLAETIPTLDAAEHDEVFFFQLEHGASVEPTIDSVGKIAQAAEASSNDLSKLKIVEIGEPQPEPFSGIGRVPGKPLEIAGVAESKESVQGDQIRKDRDLTDLNAGGECDSFKPDSESAKIGAVDSPRADSEESNPRKEEGSGAFLPSDEVNPNDTKCQEQPPIDDATSEAITQNSGRDDNATPKDGDEAEDAKISDSGRERGSSSAPPGTADEPISQILGNNDKTTRKDGDKAVHGEISNSCGQTGSSVKAEGIADEQPITDNSGDEDNATSKDGDECIVDQISDARCETESSSAGRGASDEPITQTSERKDKATPKDRDEGVEGKISDACCGTESPSAAQGAADEMDCEQSAQPSGIATSVDGEPVFNVPALNADVDMEHVELNPSAGNLDAQDSLPGPEPDARQAAGAVDQPDPDQHSGMDVDVPVFDDELLNKDDTIPPCSPCSDLTELELDDEFQIGVEGDLQPRRSERLKGVKSTSAADVKTSEIQKHVKKKVVKKGQDKQLVEGRDHNDKAVIGRKRAAVARDFQSQLSPSTTMPRVELSTVIKPEFDRRCILYNHCGEVTDVTLRFYAMRVREEVKKLLTGSNHVNIVLLDTPPVSETVVPRNGCPSPRPLSLHPAIRAIEYTEYLRMDRASVQDAFSVQHLLLHGYPIPLEEQRWHPDVISLVGSMDEDRQLHDLHLREQPGVEGDRQIVLGSFRDVYQQGLLDWGRLLNCLQIPGKFYGLEQFRVDKLCCGGRAYSHTESATGFEGLGLPEESASWHLLATKNCSHPAHVDTSGFATMIAPQTGSKLVFILVPGLELPSYVEANSSLSFADLEEDMGNEVDMVPVTIVLRPGDVLLMRPCTPHYVVTLENSLCHGSHFFAATTMTDTCVGIMHTFTHQLHITNQPDVEHRLTLARVMCYWESFLVDSTYFDRDRLLADVPNLKTSSGVFDFLSLYNVILLGSVLWTERYEGLPIDPRYRSLYVQARRAANQICDWLTKQIEVCTSDDGTITGISVTSVGSGASSHGRMSISTLRDRYLIHQCVALYNAIDGRPLQASSEDINVSKFRKFVVEELKGSPELQRRLRQELSEPVREVDSYMLPERFPAVHQPCAEDDTDAQRRIRNKVIGLYSTRSNQTAKQMARLWDTLTIAKEHRRLRAKLREVQLRDKVPGGTGEIDDQSASVSEQASATPTVDLNQPNKQVLSIAVPSVTTSTQMPLPVTDLTADAALLPNLNTKRKPDVDVDTAPTKRAKLDDEIVLIWDKPDLRVDTSKPLYFTEIAPFTEGHPTACRTIRALGNTFPFTEIEYDRLESPSQWMNDGCVEGITRALGALHRPFSDECAFFSPLMVQRILQPVPMVESVWKIARRTEYWRKETWILPLHSESTFHWMLVVFKPKLRQVWWFDSMVEREVCERWIPKIGSILGLLIKLVIDSQSHQFIFPDLLPMHGWELRPMEKRRLQHNEFACGIWVVWVIAALFRNFDYALADDGGIAAFRKFLLSYMRSLPVVGSKPDKEGELITDVSTAPSPQGSPQHEEGVAEG
ncbi:hypothetical protein V5O48_009588 [Marasmius crinis-equi]|uniref:JmjC domain-containing protein n=1 Tax=Marasmius crinis-equi TaxID=585013 RepID=A0ABR3FAT5_9AGAR